MARPAARSILLLNRVNARLLRLLLLLMLLLFVGQEEHLLRLTVLLL